jgi:hypothetical protein
MAPLNQSTAVSGFSFRANPAAEQVIARGLYYVVTPGYAEALKLRLIEGRLLQPSDSTSPIQAMVVNDAFVKSYDRRQACDRTTVSGPAGGSEGHDRNCGGRRECVEGWARPAAAGRDAVAHSPARQITREINLGDSHRSRSEWLRYHFAIDRARRRADGCARRVATLASRVSESVGQPRFATAVLGVFAALALVLAATGLYGVLSYSVSQRRREIGIRTALGATRGSLIALVVRQGMTVTLVGLVLGVLASVLATRLMQPLLFGVTPLDLPSFALMPLILLVVALVACAVPARRAAATDPAQTLRSE